MILVAKGRNDNFAFIWLKKFRSQKLRSLENIALHIEHQSLLFILSPLYVHLCQNIGNVFYLKSSCKAGA